jgi:anti-sigma-K factor RskA
MDYSKPDRAEALAAQYVAGTMRGGARRRFENLLAAHPALRGAVNDWQDRLMPLTTALPPVQPAPKVWQAIQRRLWPAAAPAAKPSLWQTLNLWRTLSAVATVAVVALGVRVATPPPAEAPIVVVLQGTPAAPGAVGAAGGVVASFSADGSALVARPLTPVSLQTDRVLELWWARETGAPKSLGLIKADGTTVLRKGQLPGGLRGSGIDHMAVSVEPPGGSPTGAPTGPVVFYGKLQL